ncbi:helix-turn-helix domain-containing protein [Bailinhaonella thermotolerans]|uniref:Uncharacterized protein n=1 Tax=Bailinhaonella thermotolerans TaxID=1070861 RepID=A0A3A3ZZW2_9ACTN|nr:helix-turn-helix domain-containing protein [Bailinhaonella thermotolerans]RJL19279.1 hypothetical protein D5H75_40520 [Bailinhaonella thermotolerans]
MRHHEGEHPDGFAGRRRRRDGGEDLVIGLPPAAAAVLGDDAADLARDLAEVLLALSEIRTGAWDERQESPHEDAGLPASRQRHHMTIALYLLDRQLLPRLQGIRTATLRLLRQHGYSHGEIAELMGVPRQTAVSRWRALEAAEPDEWERWARGQNPSPE